MSSFIQAIIYQEKECLLFTTTLAVDCIFCVVPAVLPLPAQMYIGWAPRSALVQNFMRSKKDYLLVIFL
jgi:hypothetical protein